MTVTSNSCAASASTTEASSAFTQAAWFMPGGFFVSDVGMVWVAAATSQKSLQNQPRSADISSAIRHPPSAIRKLALDAEIAPRWHARKRPLSRERP
jgi:hypothetical protein